MYSLMVIGLDESYTQTGIGIAADHKLLKVSSEAFKGCRNKSEKRKRLALLLSKIIEMNQQKASRMVIICERIRTFSKGKGDDDEAGPGQFISTNYIKATGALIATIVDTAYEYGIPVFSVDTRSWKSKILGNSKGSSTEGNKMKAIKYVTRLGFDVSYVNKKGETCYNDDAADAGCIALYGFVPKDKRSLKKEE